MTEASSKSALMIAAPQSGSGKTIFTLALLRALQKSGIDVCSAKAGPDFIDPGFHRCASGKTCINLDPWAMRPPRVQALARQGEGSHMLIESMMGLYDGSLTGRGTPAELSKLLGIPVLLIVDCSNQSHSVAALVKGFRDFDPDLQLAGTVLNKVGSPRHETMLRQALKAIDVTVFGALHRSDDLSLSHRHLGLQQAEEHADLDDFITRAADRLAGQCDMPEITQQFMPLKRTQGSTCYQSINPLGQHIAIAKDEAFSFCYPHMLTDWRQQGAEISFFSPLHDESPPAKADSIFLPGGYPELHGATLACAHQFQAGMQIAAQDNKLIYGECGGYMVLGKYITDKTGRKHQMLGLLPLETSFKTPKRHLGYRHLTALNPFPCGGAFTAHEFHYSSETEAAGEPLFSAKDAMGRDLGTCGLQSGTVMGSYMHVIDRAANKDQD